MTEIQKLQKQVEELTHKKNLERMHDESERFHDTYGTATDYLRVLRGKQRN